MKFVDDYSPEELVQLFAVDCLVALDGNLPIPNDIAHKLMIVYCGSIGVQVTPKKLFVNLLRKHYTQIKHKDQVCFRAGIRPGYFTEDL